MVSVANKLGASYRAVLGWAKRPGFPVEPDGTYRLSSIRKWRKETFDFRGANIDHATSTPQMKALREKRLRAKVEKLEAEADFSEHKLKEDSRLWACRVAVRRRVESLFAFVESELADLPDAIGACASSSADDICNEARHKIALAMNSCLWIPECLGDAPSSEPAAHESIFDQPTPNTQNTKPTSDLQKRRMIAEARKDEADAARKRISLLAERGDLVARKECSSSIRVGFTSLTQLLEAMPESICTSVPSTERSDFVASAKDVVRERLIQLSCRVRQGDDQKAAMGGKPKRKKGKKNARK